MLLAWGVHLFTASGAVLAAVALHAVHRGGFGLASLLMLAALVVDSVDGTLARRVGVAEAVPGIDGRRLDDIVDYLNYVIVPVVFLLALGALPHWIFAVAPVLASAYGFSQRDAKTDDDFFLGWPSYWNVVAIYIWLLDLSPWAATAWVHFFALAVFVPLKYIYPSKLRVVRGPTLWLACGWGALLVTPIFFPALRDAAFPFVEVSLLFPAYYVGVSAWLGDWFGLRA
ncbi:MAG: CDP-alcohol phosphatidyltransferase family protein [Myxococcota bacterium]